MNITGICPKHSTILGMWCDFFVYNLYQELFSVGTWREKGGAENAVSLEIVQKKCIF